MLIWFLIIAAEIYRNYYMIEILKTKPNYLISFILRGMACILHGGIVMDTAPGEYTWFVAQITSFWLFFDLGLNWLRHKKFSYEGATSGWLDKLGLNHPAVYWSMKGVALLVLIWSLYSLWK